MRPVSPCLAVVLAISASGCVSRSVRVEVSQGSGAGARQTIAALLLKQPTFGALSLIPVRFENSRIAGPFEESGKTYYCVRTEMHGRSFGKPERPKAMVRQETRPEGAAFLVSSYDDDVCSGHKGEAYPELDGPGRRAS